MNPLRTLTGIALVSSLTLVAGCDSAPSDGDTAETTTVQVEPASWLLGEAPAEYREVAEAKQNAEAGEEIVLRGRIGGRLDPISGESPAFIIMDASVPSCADKDHDSCPTPWDYCCETPDSKAANSATIVVLDANGNPTDEDITAAGLAPLDEIIVVGTVKARPNQSVFEIHATGIHKRAGG